MLQASVLKSSQGSLPPNAINILHMTIICRYMNNKELSGGDSPELSIITANAWTFCLGSPNKMQNLQVIISRYKIILNYISSLLSFR
jgi:hypothetical protein